MIELSTQANVEYISSGLFRSDGVWQHPKRVIDSYEIIFMHEGIAYIYEDGIEYTLKKNDILVLEPGKLHYGFKESKEFVSFSWIHFKTTKENYKNLPKHMQITEPYILKNLVKAMTTVESLKFDEFASMLLPLPPLAEQKRIADVLERVLGVFE